MDKRKITEFYNKNAGQFYTVNKSLICDKTKFQDIELVETDEYGKVLLLDGFTQVVEKNEFEYHEPMVHIAMLSHHNPENILIIGGGDGGILREVYKHQSVKMVDFVELDEDVVKFSEKYLPSINDGSFKDSRTNFIFDDGRKFVFDQNKKYDVIIMDMTDPFGPSEMLYTMEFFAAVKNALKNEMGLFVMHSESPVARPLAFGSIRQTLSKIFNFVNPVYNYVQMYGTLWSFAISSEKNDLSKINYDEIRTKLTTSSLSKLKLIDENTYFSLQKEFPYIKEILSQKHKIIMDEDSRFPDVFSQE